MLTRTRPSRQAMRRLVVSGLGVVLVVTGTAALATGYQLARVGTDVMAPGIDRGERVLADRSGSDDLRRGDVVLVNGSAWPDESTPGIYTFRIAALGGDEVACCDDSGRLLVNGEAVREEYASGDTGAFGPFTVTVPDGRVFLLGDQRERARDSRARLSTGDGTVAAGDVRGRVLWVVWPAGNLAVVDSAERGGTEGASAAIYAMTALALGVVLVTSVAAPAAYRRLARLRRASRARPLA